MHTYVYCTLYYTVNSGCVVPTEPVFDDELYHWHIDLADDVVNRVVLKRTLRDMQRVRRRDISAAAKHVFLWGVLER